MTYNEKTYESWNMGSDYYKYLHELQDLIGKAVFQNKAEDVYKLLYLEFMHIENKIVQKNVEVNIKEWDSKTKKSVDRKLTVDDLYSEFDDYKIRISQNKPPSFDEIMNIRKMLYNFEREMHMLEPNVSSATTDFLEPNQEW